MQVRIGKNKGGCIYIYIYQLRKITALTFPRVDHPEQDMGINGDFTMA